MVGHGDKVCSEQWGHCGATGAFDWEAQLATCGHGLTVLSLFLLKVNSTLAMSVTQLERMTLTDTAVPVWDGEKHRGRKERRDTALCLTQPVRHCAATHSRQFNGGWRNI